MISPPALMMRARARSVTRRAQTDDDSDLVCSCWILHVTDQSVQRNRRTIDLAHEQPFEDNLVELGISSSGQEAVKLH